VADNAPGTPQTVALTGTGLGAPIVSLSASSLTFSATVTATSASQNLTLTNSGTAALTLTSNSVALAGANPGDYAIKSNGCTGNVAVKGTCTIAITFSPTATGARPASLQITDNAANSPQSVALNGTGLSQVTLSATSIAFPGTHVGASASKTVTVSNAGAVALSITPFTVTGTNAGDFTQTNNCGTSIAAAKNCTVTVVFKPTAKGTRTATLNILDSAVGSPQTVALSGTGQ
jgi:hypothetical protein